MPGLCPMGQAGLWATVALCAAAGIAIGSAQLAAAAAAPLATVHTAGRRSVAACTGTAKTGPRKPNRTQGSKFFSLLRLHLGWRLL